jgi:hypothetical protein
MRTGGRTAARGGTVGRKQARWAALAAPALALLGGCIGGNLGSFECVSSPQIAFTDGPATGATVGMPYFQGLAASAATLLWPVSPCRAI